MKIALVKHCHQGMLVQQMPGEFICEKVMMLGKSKFIGNLCRKYLQYHGWAGRIVVTKELVNGLVRKEIWLLM